MVLAGIYEATPGIVGEEGGGVTEHKVTACKARISQWKMNEPNLP